MKKPTEQLKSDIKILQLGRLPMFKENKTDFRQFKETLVKTHKVSCGTIDRELRKIKDK